MRKISVIIATHNRPKLLKRALESLLQQKYQFHQIIVVADVNDPETYQVASASMRSEDLFIQRLGRPGPAESRNAGMKFVSGDYFMFLDDDDTFRPDFLDVIKDSSDIVNNNNVLLYTNFEVVNEKMVGNNLFVENVDGIDIEGYDPLMVYVKNFIPNNCLIFPGMLIPEITFDPLISYEDWDFILSACAHVPIKHIPILGPRVHKNIAPDYEARGKNNNAGLLDCYIKIYRKHPPPNLSVSLWRRELFSSIDLEIDSLVNNEPLLC